MTARRSGSIRTQFQPSARLVAPVTEARDHIAGPATAKVTLVEYGDYQCPYCGEAHPIVKKVRSTYGDKLRFVFRNFPLPEVHPRAEFGAELAEAAGAQGKFGEMHDYIYENQASLNDEQFFVRFAKNLLGLDVKRLTQDIGSGAHSQRIREDFVTGIRSGVNGTPTFFINGARHDYGFDFESFTAAIDPLLKR